MLSVQNDFIQTYAQPVLLIVTAYLAGSNRLIQVFNGSTQAGLCLAAGGTAAAAAIQQKVYPSENEPVYMTALKKTACVGLGLIVASAIGIALNPKGILSTAGGLKFGVIELAILHITHFTSAMQLQSGNSAAVDSKSDASLSDVEVVFAEKNQFEFENGKSACTVIASSFIKEALDNDPDTLSIDKILDEGIRLYPMHQLRHKGKLRNARFSEKEIERELGGITFDEVVGCDETLKCEQFITVKLDKSNEKAVKDMFTPILSRVKSGKKIAIAMTLNRKSHAMVIERKNNDSYKFFIFDSHGKEELNDGNQKAFIYKTTDRAKAEAFLFKMLNIYDLDEEGLEKVNELRYTIVEKK